MAHTWLRLTDIFLSFLCSLFWWWILINIWRHLNIIVLSFIENQYWISNKRKTLNSSCNTNYCRSHFGNDVFQRLFNFPTSSCSNFVHSSHTFNVIPKPTARSARARVANFASLFTYIRIKRPDITQWIQQSGLQSRPPFWIRTLDRFCFNAHARKSTTW